MTVPFMCGAGLFHEMVKQLRLGLVSIFNMPVMRHDMVFRLLLTRQNNS